MAMVSSSLRICVFSAISLVYNTYAILNSNQKTLGFLSSFSCSKTRDFLTETVPNYKINNVMVIGSNPTSAIYVK